MNTSRTVSFMKTDFPPLVVTVLPHTPTSHISKLVQRPLLNFSAAWMYSGNEHPQRKPVGALTSSTLVLLVKVQKENPWGYYEKLSGLVGDDFCFGDGMRDCALYFRRTFCCQRAGLLFYLCSQSPSDWYCRSLLIHMRSWLLQLGDTSTGVCSIKFRTELGGFWNIAS